MSDATPPSSSEESEGSDSPSDPGSESSSETVSPLPPLPTRPPSRRARVTTITVAALATAGVVIAGVSVVADLADRSSKVDSTADTLLVESAAPADPYADALVIGEVDPPARPTHANPLDWRVPVDAPFETFPTNFVQNTSSGETWLDCSEEQFAWLEEHAQPYDATSSSSVFNLTLRNTANEGGALPLGNIRFEGEEVDSAPWVALQCTVGGRGNAGGLQPMLINVDGSEAVYGEVLSAYSEDAQPEGSPVTVNLAPGEINELVLTRDLGVDLQRQYEGRFLADVLDGSDETVILANEVSFKRQNVPGFKIHYIGYDNQPEGEAGQMLCIRPIGEPNEYGNFEEYDKRACSTAEVVDMLKDAAAAAKRATS